jgi:hypothetical protein
VFRDHGGVKQVSEVFSNLITILSGLKQVLMHTFLPQTLSQYDMLCYVMTFIPAKHAITLEFLQKLFKKDSPCVNFI